MNHVGAVKIRREILRFLLRSPASFVVLKGTERSPVRYEVLRDHAWIPPQLLTHKLHTLQLYTGRYVQVITTKSAASPQRRFHTFRCYRGCFRYGKFQGQYGEANSFVSLSLPEFVCEIQETTSIITSHLLYNGVLNCGQQRGFYDIPQPRNLPKR
jgi:hypothetical protein